MVTPVNEFSPACVSRTFRVREDAGPHTLLGSVVGTDMDYPHNSIEYHTSGGSIRWEGGNRNELRAGPNSASHTLPPRPADGVVRTAAPLELTPATKGAAVTRLQVKAFERLRPWASVELDLTVKVRSVNRWPPRCLPELLV